MNRALRHTIALAAAVLACIGTFGQAWENVPVSDFVQAKRASDALYVGLERFRITMEMTSYRSVEDRVPHDRTMASIVREGTRFRSEVGGIITVQDATIRVVRDPEEGKVFATDPVKLEDAWAIGVANLVLSSLVACERRTLDGHTEYRVRFSPGSVQEHMVVRYDAAGWLRSTSTVWRRPIAEDPSDPLSAAYRPRLEVAYGIPVVLKGPPDPVTDPWRLVKRGEQGLVAIGEWTGAPVIEARLRP